MEIQDNIKFTKKLIKGKIAETVFAQMFGAVGNFTVIPFGFENTFPELLHNGKTDYSETAEILRTSPDFAIIDRNTKEVKLVEVKYHKEVIENVILEQAQKISGAWSPSFLFIASKDGFYFEDIEMIMAKGGSINELNVSYVPKEIQDEYLKVLNQFEH